MTNPATDFSTHIRELDDGRHSLRLAVEGMNCAGCAFKIEKHLNTNQNVEARVNVTEKRLTLVWSGDKSNGNDLLASTETLGFRFSPVRQTDASQEEQSRSLLRAMAVAGFSSGNLMIFSLALWFTTRNEMGGSTRDLMHWYSALIGLPTVAYAGLPFFKSAWNAICHRRTNMDVPISVAVLLASGMSLFETIRGGEHVYFDSAVMLLFLLLIGRHLDARARQQARSAAADLLALSTGSANVIEPEGIRRIEADNLIPGMQVLVARGEKFLADSIAGTAVLADTSAITGEILPQSINAGEPLLAGMVNLGNNVIVKVEKSAHKSLIGDIISMMQKAEQGNAAYVRLADRIAGWYTPVVHLLALATFIFWLGFTQTDWQTSLLSAITVLIITCPCALGLAVPVAQVIAGSRLFKKGMLLKSGDALERLSNIDTIVFDKTGTLTTGKIIFENSASFSPEEHRLISTLAATSAHPLARAAMTRSDILADVPTTEHDGMGISAVMDKKKIRLGSARFAGDNIDSADDQLELWFSVEGTPPKRLVFNDCLHDDAKETIATLQKQYRVILLSGDRHKTVKSIANAAGIQIWHAAMNPKDKLVWIEKEKEQRHRLLMVGDGLNDAAALTAANVSMSPASALDITQNAADIVYQQHGIGSVIQAITIARKTQTVVKQNFSMALGYNVIAIPLAIAGYVTPLLAAVAMSASSLVVVMNALRLRKA